MSWLPARLKKAEQLGQMVKEQEGQTSPEEWAPYHGLSAMSTESELRVEFSLPTNLAAFVSWLEEYHTRHRATIDPFSGGGRLRILRPAVWQVLDNGRAELGFEADWIVVRNTVFRLRVLRFDVSDQEGKLRIESACLFVSTETPYYWLHLLGDIGSEWPSAFSEISDAIGPWEAEMPR